jgi:GT2 family glycosyltransferase/glycosyltransferase involved in cell wall biosynthesis
MDSEVEEKYHATDIVIPFYKNAGLVRPLFDSLERVTGELIKNYTVVAVNDSAEDVELEVELSAAVERLSRQTPCRLVRNTRNMGFVRSVNQALAIARETGHDALLLNSDTVIFPGAMTELRRVAYLDPMTGFASPRSNNATICSLPCQKEFRCASPADAYENFLALSKYLPEYNYVPTAVGFCLYIKSEILVEFGIFDEAFGLGYNEENDLIMRANRCGYRAVLANRAFVYHVGEVSFSASGSAPHTLETENAALLQRRYNEYPTAVRDYFNSAQYRAEEMLSALLPDSEGRLDLVFDFSSMGPYHNGTSDVGKRLLRGALQHWHHKFNIFVMASNEARDFHELNKLPRVYIVSPQTERTFAISLRFGQPFGIDHLVRMSRTGVINVFGMLDTIALDCLYLHHSDLSTIWGFVCQHANGVIYNSEFVRDQFHRRFRFGCGVRELVSYHSFDLRDYAPEPQRAEAGDYILVVGNKFEHKRVPVTVEALSRAFPRVKVLVLGVDSAEGQNVIAYQSGSLSEASIHNLLRNAKFVVYPSLYEGFGIPVLEGLAHWKPVLARSIPVMRAIRERIAARDNLILYDSTGDLIARLREGFPQWKPVPSEACGAEPYNWSAISVNIGAFLEDLVREWSFSDSLVPRLEFVSLLEGDSQTDRHQARADRAALRDREAAIKDIYGSLSWRVTAPLRWVGGVILRMGRGKK